ncbi:hypothetical protein CYG49_02005 [Candidatus Saccharibacteria bacterium]|nr:MAG: hypothetical protein CYG49_02005 [Candidatus Saccharibacteria bacterium]
MVGQHPTDTIINVLYSPRSDVFFLKVVDREVTDPVFVSLGSGTIEEYALFDNALPGTLLSVVHKGDNMAAMEKLGTLFNSEYVYFCQVMREQAVLLKNSTKQRAQLIVPYTHRRRFERIKLHSLAEAANKRTKDTARLIERYIKLHSRF